MIRLSKKKLVPSGSVGYYLQVFACITRDFGLRFPQVAGCQGKSYCRSSRRLDGKTVVLTGGNAGIGRVTAEFLWKQGADMIIVCRDQKRGQEAIDEMKRGLVEGDKVGSIKLALMDLASFASIRKCAQHLNKSLKRIDILVNNAGIMATPFELTQDGFEKQFQVNHLGHFLFTLLLLPKILDSTPARIVTVSSTAHTFFSDMEMDSLNDPEQYYPVHAYFRSKAANIFFSRELSKRLRGKGVNAYCLNPGYINTNLYQYSSETFMPGFRMIVRGVAWYIKDPWEGAQTTIHCAMCETVEEETGLYYDDCRVHSVSKTCRDDDFSKWLWDKSMEWVGLDPTIHDPINLPPFNGYSPAQSSDKSMTAIAGS